MIVCGTAGTGKYLISTAKHVLGAQCVVTATTVIAAFSINGQTLHSAAQLPIDEYWALQADSLQQLQLRLEKVYHGELQQDIHLPHLICTSCTRRLNNFSQFKKIVTETQHLLREEVHTKRCVKLSPSVAKLSTKVQATGSSCH
jgi:hypothetical protein